MHSVKVDDKPDVVVFDCVINGDINLFLYIFAQSGLSNSQSIDRL